MTEEENYQEALAIFVKTHMRVNKEELVIINLKQDDRNH